MRIDDWPSRSLVTVIGEDTQRLATVANGTEADGTAGLGTFQVAGLRAGSYTLSVQVEGHLPLVQSVSVEGADAVLATPLTLTPMAVRYSAAVQDQHGEPPFGNTLAGTGPIVNGVDVEPLAAQVVGEKRAKLDIIVRQQDLGHQRTRF